MLDVNRARLVHLKWVWQLESAFRNRGKNAVVQSHADCDVGVWIHGTGLRKHGDIAEIKALDEQHRKFHGAVQSTLTALRSRKDGQAAKAYAEVNALSKEIIFLLTVIELKLGTPGTQYSILPDE